jgi:hypothetical protein
MKRDRADGNDALSDGASKVDRLLPERCGYVEHPILEPHPVTPFAIEAMKNATLKDVPQPTLGHL